MTRFFAVLMTVLWSFCILGCTHSSGDLPIAPLPTAGSAPAQTQTPLQMQAVLSEEQGDGTEAPLTPPATPGAASATSVIE